MLSSGRSPSVAAYVALCWNYSDLDLARAAQPTTLCQSADLRIVAEWRSTTSV